MNNQKRPVTCFEKGKTVVTVILLFLLMILPLNLLSSKLLYFEENEKKRHKVEITNLLNDELSEFKHDLNQENFLNKYLRRKIPEEWFINKILTATSLPAELAEQDFKSLLRQIYERLDSDLKPLFIVLADSELKNVYFRFSHAFTDQQKVGKFAVNLKDEQFLARYLASFASQGNEDKFRSASLNKVIKNFARTSKNDPDVAPDKYYYRGIISSFIKRPPVIHRVNTYFSDIFGLQNLYFYSFPVNDEDEQKSILVIGYLNETLGDKTLIRHSPGLGETLEIKRFCRKKRSSYVKTSDTIEVAEPLSGVLSQDFFRQHEFGVRLKKSENQDRIKVRKCIDWLRKLIFLAFVALLTRSLLFKMTIPLPLRWKLAAIFILAIILPAITGLALIFGIDSTNVAMKNNLAQTRLSNELNKIEIYFDEVISRQVLHNLRFKQLVSHSLRNKTVDKLNFDDVKMYMGNNISSSFIYGRTGATFAALRYETRYKHDTLKLSNAVRSLKNLGCLESNPKTRKDLDKMIFATGFAEKLTGRFDLSDSAGSEGENILRTSDINPLSRSHFYLFPDLNSENLAPRAIGFFELGPEMQFAEFIRSKPNYLSDFFVKNEQNQHIEIGFARRDAAEIKREFWLDPSFRHNSALKNIFAKAMSIRDSGETINEASRSDFHAWRFYENKPFISAGIASINRNSFSDFYLEITPYTAFIATVIIILLISEIMANLFLSPIKLLSEGVKTISDSGNFALEIEIDNNDEFDLLGKSFNTMTRGLLHKKHISRFVSDRLVSAIETSSKSDIDSSSNFSEMTILASDIRSFTSISETRAPEEVVEILNSYFTSMEECIKSEGGIIDKFIGDAIIAVFLPEAVENPCLKACNAALKMRKALQNFNESEQMLERKLEIENGIGIATGLAIAASIGSSCSRKDFTIVGELVELAETLETLTKSGAHTRIIIDKATFGRVKNDFALTDSQTMKTVEYFEIIERKQLK